MAYRSKLLWLLLAVLMLGIVFAGHVAPVARFTELLKTWLAGVGAWGPIVFSLVYVMATVLFMPVVALTTAAGVLFDLWIGVALVSFASTLSAALTFLLARRLGRERVTRWVQGQPRLTALERAIAQGGWKVVALLRLSSIMPFSVQNYLFGLTPLGFWPYLITSWLAMLPGTVLYVYLGHVADATLTATGARTTAEWMALAVGLAAALGVGIYLAALAKDELRKQSDCD